MRRTNTLLIAAAGGALSLTLGSGLLALTSDSVTSGGNEFASDAIAPTPTTHDVRATFIASGLAATCDEATPLEDGPLTATISGRTIDLANNQTLNQTEDVCIRNDGSSQGRLRVSLANIISTELGACETSENAAGDTTCGLGAAGELQAAVSWSFVKASGPHTSTSCATSAAAAFSTTSIGTIDTDLAPGETCRVFLRVTVPASTTDVQKQQAQTDRLQFAVVFTLEDATAP